MIEETGLEESIMTIKEIAGYLKINERTVYKLAKEQKIPALKIGGTWRFKKDIIDMWIESTMKQNI